MAQCVAIPLSSKRNIGGYRGLWPTFHTGHIKRMLALPGLVVSTAVFRTPGDTVTVKTTANHLAAWDLADCVPICRWIVLLSFQSMGLRLWPMAGLEPALLTNRNSAVCRLCQVCVYLAWCVLNMHTVACSKGPRFSLYLNKGSQRT